MAEIGDNHTGNVLRLIMRIVPKLIIPPHPIIGDEEYAEIVKRYKQDVSSSFTNIIMFLKNDEESETFRQKTLDKAEVLVVKYIKYLREKSPEKSDEDIAGMLIQLDDKNNLSYFKEMVVLFGL